jgi:hypothetical protein
MRTYDPTFCLSREEGTPKANEQRGRSGIYLDAAGLSQRALGEPAAKHTDGRDICLPRCGGITSWQSYSGETSLSNFSQMAVKSGSQ